MKVVWNRELKKLAVIALCIFGMGILVMNLCIGAYCNRIRAEIGRASCRERVCLYV